MTASALRKSAAVEVTSCGLAKCLKGNMPASLRVWVGRRGGPRGGRSGCMVRGLEYLDGALCWPPSARLCVVYFCVCPCLSASRCFCVCLCVGQGDFAPVGFGARQGVCRCAGRVCLRRWLWFRISPSMSAGVQVCLSVRVSLGTRLCFRMWGSVRVPPSDLRSQSPPAPRAHR